MRLSPIVTALAALSLGACATLLAPTPKRDAAADRAYCQDLLKMGTGAEHDHGRDKTGAQGRMAAEHQRCNALLAH